MDINEKTIVVTGAGRGLGAAMAEYFAARGAKLALIDVDESGLADVFASCEQAGAEARTYTANVADEGEVVSTYARVTSDFGHIDVSIANAGILRDGMLVKSKVGSIVDKMSLADWQAVIDVNLTGVFLCGREAAASMIESGTRGCIINISSISRQGNFGQSNYSAAKAGVAALTVVWAKELARSGVRVNAIAPGFVATDILKSMKPEVLDKITAGIPAGRLGEPAEIAATAAYIIHNDYLNGRVIDVDGGLRI